MKKLNSNPELPPKLKRFLAFGATSFNTMGGWDDFRGDFDSKHDAISYLGDYILEEIKSRKLTPNKPWDIGWAQIFDTETKEITWTEQNN